MVIFHEKAMRYVLTFLLTCRRFCPVGCNEGHELATTNQWLYLACYNIGRHVAGSEEVSVTMIYII